MDSTLWRVNVAASKLEYFPLARTSGEDSNDITAEWWIQDTQVWIAYRSGDGFWITHLNQAKSKGAWIVSQPGSTDYESVSRNALKQHAGVIPSRLSPATWETALAYETEAEARKVASRVPGSSLNFWPQHPPSVNY